MSSAGIIWRRHFHSAAALSDLFACRLAQSHGRGCFAIGSQMRKHANSNAAGSGIFESSEDDRRSGDRGRSRRSPGSAARGGPGRAHRAGDQLQIWRHGRQRRTGSGAEPRACRPANQPSSATRALRHHCGRPGAGLSPGACACPRGHRRCACALFLARADRFCRSDGPRERGRRALRRPPHRRHRGRAEIFRRTRLSSALAA